MEHVIKRIDVIGRPKTVNRLDRSKTVYGIYRPKN